MKKDPKTGKALPAFLAKKKNGNGNAMKKNGNGMNGNGKSMNGLTALPGITTSRAIFSCCTCSIA